MHDVPTWKIHPPITNTSKGAGWVTRRRLLERLHRSAHLPLTLVVAPAGYGKTTLLAEFAHQCPYPMAWLSLDESDRDLITFIEEESAVLGMASTGLGRKTRAAAQHAGSDRRAAATLAGALVSELAGVPTQIGLVLDDWHLVDDSVEVAAAAQFLIDRLPPNAHLFLLSRVRPNLDLTRRAANRELGAIGWSELAFTPSEAEALLARRDAALGADEIRALAAAAEGWAMGMLLAVEGGTAASLGAARDADTPLAEYLTRAVFDDLEADELDVLLIASLIEPITSSMCDTLLARRDSARILRTLSERGLVGADGRGWRLHHLIGGYLRQRLENADPERFYALQERIADFAIKAGDLAGAIDHLLAGCHHVHAASLLELHGERIGNSGRWRSIVYWLSALPETTVGQRPSLLALWARAAIRLGNPQQGLTLASRAVALANELEDGPAAVWARLIYAHALFSVGRSQTAVEICEDALSDQHIRNNGAMYAEAQRTMAIALGRLGRFAPALDHIQTALALFDRAGDLPNVAYSLNSAGLYCTSLGRLDQAMAFFSRARALRHELDDEAGEAVVDTNLACVELTRGQYVNAIRLLEQSVATDERLGDRRGLAAHLAILGGAYRAVGACERATTTYQRALVACDDAHYAIGTVEALDGLARLSRAAGRLGDAERYVHEAQGEAEAAGSVYLRGLCELTLGDIARDAGRLADGLRHFKHAARLMGESGQRDGQARAAFGAALTHHRTGNTQPALRALGEALKITTEMRAHAFLLTDDDDAARLVEEAEKHGIEPWAAGQLLEDLERLTNIRESWGREEEPTSPRRTLGLHAFGAGTVEVDGRLIHPANWTRAKARDLFFAIGAAPAGRSRAELQLDLWPEMPESQFIVQWRSALYGIRLTVGAEWIVERDGRYALASDAAHDVWCDIQAFEAAVARGRAAVDDERAACYREALALSNDSFLTSSGSQWAHNYRLRLDTLYEECLLWLCVWAERSGQFEEALRCAERLLERDDDQQEIHALILRCHLATRNPHLAVRHFRAYVRRARRRGLQPTTELAHLHQRALARTL